MEFILSLHARDVLKERAISEEWLNRTLEYPDWTTEGSDVNRYYYKKIAEHKDRILHAVVNHTVVPKKIVTVFFDRGARRKE